MSSVFGVGCDEKEHKRPGMSKKGRPTYFSRVKIILLTNWMKAKMEVLYSKTAGKKASHFHFTSQNI